MSDSVRASSAANDAVQDDQGKSAARAKWQTPELHQMSAKSAENSGNTGDDGPGASS